MSMTGLNVGIINYGIGNISSIRSALRNLGAETKLISEFSDTIDCSHFILPGVGAMRVAMDEIRKQKLENTIRLIISSKKPILGICLGMQLLASRGYEASETEGLNLIAGEVHRIDTEIEQRKLPRFGWINVEAKGSSKSSLLLNGIEINKFYFAHSYHFIPENVDHIAAVDDEGLVVIEGKIVLALVPDEDFEDWDETLNDGLEE